MEPSERASPFTELRAAMSEAVGLVTFGQFLLKCYFKVSVTSYFYKLPRNKLQFNSERLKLELCVRFDSAKTELVILESLKVDE